MINVYEDYEGVLPMAIRLRKAGTCPRDVDDVYGEIMRGIVRMAAVLLPREDPRYEPHARDFLDEEVQSAMLCHCLVAAEKYVDTAMGHRKAVNYLVKSVQNRLRNWVRDTEARKRRIDMVTESDAEAATGVELPSLSGLVMTLDGRVTYAETSGKVSTANIN